MAPHAVIERQERPEEGPPAFFEPRDQGAPAAAKPSRAEELHHEIRVRLERLERMLGGSR